LLISLTFGCSLLGFDQEQIEEAPVVVVEKKPVFDQEEWETVKGRWLISTPKKDRRVLNIPCEGEEKTLVFSSRMGKAFLSIIEGVESMELIEVTSFEYQENVFLLDGFVYSEDGQKSQSKKDIQFYLEDGVLQYTNELFLRSNSNVEIIYQEDSLCDSEDMKNIIPEFSLKNTEFSELFGTWKTRNCGENKMILSDLQFTFFEKQVPIIAMNQVEKNEYWLTILAGTNRHGVKIKKTNSGLYVWNGDSPSWTRFEFIPEKDCE